MLNVSQLSTCFGGYFFNEKHTELANFDVQLRFQIYKFPEPNTLNQPRVMSAKKFVTFLINGKDITLVKLKYHTTLMKAINYG